MAVNVHVMEQSTNSESPWIRVDFGMSASLFDFFGVVGDRLLTVETLLTHFCLLFILQADLRA